MDSRKIKHRNKTIVAMALIAAVSALFLLTADPAGTITYPGDIGEDDFNQQHRQTILWNDSTDPYTYSWRTARQLDVPEEIATNSNEQTQLTSVCGRYTHITQEMLALQQQYETCPQYDSQTPILVLEGYLTYGRTANQLRSLQGALQYSRDNNVQLGIMFHSWAVDVLLKFFMITPDVPWETNLEQALCVKIIHVPDELEGREVTLKNALELFYYRSSKSPEEFVASQLYTLRTLFRHYNTGEGEDHYGNEVRDMCSGVKALLGGEEPSLAVYSVIHIRHLERAGNDILKAVAKMTGCDPYAALSMPADYVKSILAPLGMMEHPIVIITDGQDKTVLQRLMGDKDIGRHIKVVPKDARWLGGDITLAIMADVFIGNPASTFSGFIAKSRRAMGFTGDYLYRFKDDNGEWQNACGSDNDCLFGGGTGTEKSTNFDENLMKTWQLKDRRYEGKKEDEFTITEWYKKTNGKDTTPRSTLRARKKVSSQTRLSAEQWVEKQHVAQTGLKLRALANENKIKLVYHDGEHPGHDVNGTESLGNRGYALYYDPL